MNNLINTHNVKPLSKVELISKGTYDARKMLDEGFSNVLEMVAKARKAIEYLTAFNKECDYEARKALNDGSDITVFGTVFSLGSTGDRIDYEIDPIYKEIKAKLKRREQLLKVSKNSIELIYDEDGIEVPKLPLKSASKETLRVKL